MTDTSTFAPAPWACWPADENNFTITPQGDFADDFGMIGMSPSVDTPQKAKATAEHVIRCVNNHDKLVGLMESSLNELQEWMQAFPDGSDNTPSLIEEIEQVLASFANHLVA